MESYKQDRKKKNNDEITVYIYVFLFNFEGRTLTEPNEMANGPETGFAFFFF